MQRKREKARIHVIRLNFVYYKFTINSLKDTYSCTIQVYCTCNTSELWIFLAYNLNKIRITLLALKKVLDTININNKLRPSSQEKKTMALAKIGY